jgi:hypothetical protein
LNLQVINKKKLEQKSEREREREQMSRNPRKHESLKPKIEHELAVNHTLKNDIQSLDHQLYEKYRPLLLDALNNSPNKYASLDTGQKDVIKFALSIFVFSKKL